MSLDLPWPLCLPAVQTAMILGLCWLGPLIFAATFTLFLSGDLRACFWTRLNRVESNRPESLLHLRTLFDSALDGILLLRGDGRFLDANPAALGLLGFNRDELSGLKLARVLVDESLPRWNRQALIAGGETQGRLEIQLRRKDGTLLVAECMVKAVHRDLAYAIFRDITASKVAEETIAKLGSELELKVEQRTGELSLKTTQLEIAEERLRLALEASREGLWDWRVRTDQTYCSPAYFNMLGYQPSEFSFDSKALFQDLIHPDDRELVADRLMPALQKAGWFELEFRMLNRSGEYQWILSRGQVVERETGGEPTRVIGTHSDISQRKQAEFNLKESENRFHELADCAPVMIWLSDSDHERTFFNQGWLKFRGRASEEELGAGWREGLHPADVDYFRAMQARTSGRSGAMRWEYRLRQQDGEYRWIEEICAPRLDAAKQVLGYVGCGIDITERKRAEMDLRELNGNLERRVLERTEALLRASEAKSRFLAHMSHEIRTPMNAVMGFSQLLARENLSPRHKDMVNTICEACATLLGVINEILDYSKAEAGRIELNPQSFDLTALGQRIDNLFRSAANAKGIEWKLLLPRPEPLWMVGDALRLEQVLINLVGNAVKFTETGRVELSIKVLAETAEWRRVGFAVRDTGIGIAPDALERLFQPFSQADASITRKYGGTGLGLAISQRLIEMMGGKLEVDSEPGVGSRFGFELEFSRTNETADTSRDWIKPPSSRDSLAGLRILVVDDNRTNLKLANLVLSAAGAKVTSVDDGRQALDKLQAGPAEFDVVLMDIQMPVMDGLSATREIRKCPSLSQLPVIAFSAGILPEEQAAAQAAGFDGFIGKPLQIHQLVTALARYRS